MQKFRFILWYLREVWAFSPLLTSLLVMLRLARALQPILALYIGKLLVDEVVALSATGAASLRDGSLADLASSRLAMLLLAELATMVAGGVLTRISTLIETLLSDRHGALISSQLIAHAADLDLAQLETPETQDLAQRARIQVMSSQMLLSQVLGVAQNLVTIAGLVISIAALAPLLGLLVLVALTPMLLAESRFTDRAYGLDVALTKDRRAMEYIRALGMAPDTAREIKVFALGQWLASRFLTVAADLNAQLMRLAVRRNAWGALFSALGALAYYACYAIVIWRTATGGLTLGAMVFISGSLLRLNGLTEGLIAVITGLARQAAGLGDLRAFLRLGSTDIDKRDLPALAPLTRDIRIENLSFRYPGKEAWALRHLDLTIPAGAVAAIVGANGSGKTTLTKLLAGLYAPDEGRVLFDGADLAQTAPISRRQRIAMLFQDFARYHFRVDENIAIGDVNYSGDPQRVADAAQRGNATGFIARLPDGYQQQLGRHFPGGLDLSGGEWQRLAMSRAWFRDADVLILDEPTAALDPEAEMEVFKRLRSLAGHRTIVLISHRFSTVRVADIIFVMELGRLIETGDHASLMALDGKYAGWFRLQAEGYA